MNVAVTGAEGWIGKNVVKIIQQTEHKVVRIDLNLKGENSHKWNCLEDNNGEILAKAIKGCDCVIHCAGYAHHPLETKKHQFMFNKINVDGTKQVVDACYKAGVNRIVYISTIAAYDWANGKVAHENHALNPLTFYAKSKIEGELLVTKSGLDWRVARLGTVFGEGDKANFYKLCKALKRRRFVLPGQGSAQKSLIFLEDAAQMLFSLSLIDQPEFRLLNIANPTPASLSSICNSFSMVCDSPNVVSFPVFLLRIMGWLGDLIMQFKPDFPLTSSNLAKLTSDTVVDVSRMTKVFPHYSWSSFDVSLSKSSKYYKSV